MTDTKKKKENREVEWSFDFGNFTDSFQNMIDSLTGEDLELLTSEFKVSSEDVQTAQLTIGFSVGRGNLNPLAKGGKDLLTATIKHIGEVEFSEEGTAEKVIQIKQKGRAALSQNPFKQGIKALTKRDELEWNIAVSPDVPLSLDIHGGVGPTTLDLTTLLLTDLRIDAGVGTMQVSLPKQAASLDVDLDGGVGQSRIEIPENADMTLHIEGGVGQVEVTLPADSALKVDVTGGIGSVKMPKSLERKEKRGFGDNGGIWQSAGYELADRRITLYFSGGVGQFVVRETTEK